MCQSLPSDYHLLEDWCCPSLISVSAVPSHMINNSAISSVQACVDEYHTVFQDAPSSLLNLNEDCRSAESRRESPPPSSPCPPVLRTTAPLCPLCAAAWPEIHPGWELVPGRTDRWDISCRTLHSALGSLTLVSGRILGHISFLLPLWYLYFILFLFY